MVEVAKQLPGFTSLKSWAQGHSIKYSNAYGMLLQGLFEREDWRKIGTRYFIRIGAKPRKKQSLIPADHISLNDWQAYNNVSYKTARRYIEARVLKVQSINGYLYLPKNAQPDVAICATSMR